MIFHLSKTLLHAKLWVLKYGVILEFFKRSLCLRTHHFGSRRISDNLKNEKESLALSLFAFIHSSCPKKLGFYGEIAM